MPSNTRVSYPRDVAVRNARAEAVQFCASVHGSPAFRFEITVSVPGTRRTTSAGYFWSGQRDTRAERERLLANTLEHCLRGDAYEVA
jgi:hypothetical protein